MSEPAWNSADKILVELMDAGYSAEIIMDIAARMGKGGVIWGEPSTSFDPDDVKRSWPRPTEEELEQKKHCFKEAGSWYGHFKDELEQRDD
jgi:hypothetical protein